MVVPIIVAGARAAAKGTAQEKAQGVNPASIKSSRVQGVRGSASVRQSSVQTNAPIRTTSRKSPDTQSESITRQRRVQGPINTDYEEEFGEQSSQQNQSVKYRIGTLATLIIMSIAIFLDTTELILDLAGTFFVGIGVVFGYFKDLFTIFLIPFAFFLLGAPFWKGKKAKKKMTVMIASFAVSLIPWVGAFMPETIASAWITIRLTRKEDKEKALLQMQMQDQIDNQGRNSITRQKRS